MLKINNLSIRFGDQQILKSISFNLHKGKIMGLIGPNGAGKTSLIRTINGSLNTDSGTIIFKKQDLTTLSYQERARILTTVPQNRKIPAGFRVEQIVQMGRTPYLNWFGKISENDQALIEQALQQTRTNNLKDLMADELSGGEQQRVILARAFVQQTPLLLLDEPTTHLDIRYQMEFLELIQQQVKKNKTTVIIALHDLNQAIRFCDEVLLLSEGKVIADGKPKKVLTEKILSKVYSYPIKVKTSKDRSPDFIYPKN